MDFHQEQPSPDRGSAEGHNRVPQVRRATGSDTTVLSPSSVAEVVRTNVTAELVSSSDEELCTAYDLLNHQINIHFHSRVQLPEPRMSTDLVRSFLSRDDKRLFVLRYTGPALDIQQPNGIVELRPGNLLGFHQQRIANIMSHDLLETALRVHRGQYPGLSPDIDSYEKYLRLCADKRIPVEQAARKEGWDYFNFDHMCRMDDRGIEGGDKTAFLILISLLPTVGSMGLSEVFLKQAYAHDLDVEGTKYSFAYARVDGLFKDYVPADQQLRVAQDVLLRHIAWDQGGALPDHENELLARYMQHAGDRHLHERLDETRTSDGLSVFSSIRFHQRAGGVPICLLPWCSMDDFESMFAGGWIVAPLEELREKGEI